MQKLIITKQAQASLSEFHSFPADVLVYTGETFYSIYHEKDRIEIQVCFNMLSADHHITHLGVGKKSLSEFHTMNSIKGQMKAFNITEDEVEPCHRLYGIDNIDSIITHIIGTLKTMLWKNQAILEVMEDIN